MKATTIEVLRRRVCELTKSLRSGPGELEQVARMLQGREETELNGDPAKEGEKYRQAAARICLERRDELATDEEDNPLDDQEKLDEIRRRVFGSAPE